MSLTTKIYDNSPVWVQNLMCSLKGWQIARRRFSANFYKELSRFENGEVNGKEELCVFLLQTKSITAYQGILNDKEYAALGKGELDVYNALAKFPVLDKQTVKANIEKYTNPAFSGKSITMHTSGTTGSGLIFPYSEEMENKQWAVWWRYRKSLGINIDTWCGWIGGRTIISMDNQKPPFWRINRPGRQVMYSSHHLSPQTVQLYYEDILKRQLKWLHGYPSSATLLASLIIEKGLKPIETVRWVTTGAESLLEHHIAIIKRAFPNAMVRTHYGLSEGVANISQDIDGKWHMDDDFCFVEFIPADKMDSSVCRIIGTGFSNKAFPLVRYDTGDLVKVNWIDGKPEIVEIFGRQEEYIELPNGVKLGRLDHIFKDCVNIKEAQIHQIRKDLIELRVVKDIHYSKADEDLLMKEASSRFGQDVEIKIIYCEAIERTKAGKVRFVVSDIINNENMNKKNPPPSSIANKDAKLDVLC